MEKIELVRINQLEYGDQFKDHLIEQYKIYVEMADRISQRRMMVNTFFITLNTTIITVSGLLKNDIAQWYILIFIVGLVTSIAWFYILNSYRQLNAGKFKVVHEIEKFLPASLYDYEWSLLDKGEKKSKYWPISHIEKLIPTLFGIIYIVCASILYIFV